MLYNIPLWLTIHILKRCKKYNIFNKMCKIYHKTSYLSSLSFFTNYKFHHEKIFLNI